MLLVLVCAFVGCAFGEAPYPASGQVPQGSLFLLPQVQYGQPSISPRESEVDDLSKANDKLMERLRQEVGSDGSSYHLQLSDGLLQKVQYPTSAVQDSDPQAYRFNVRHNDIGEQNTFHQRNREEQKAAERFGRLHEDTQQQQIHQLLERQHLLEHEYKRLRDRQDTPRTHSSGYLSRSYTYDTPSPLRGLTYPYNQ